MASSRRKTLGFLSMLLFGTSVLAKYENNFDLYPAAAQPCLYAASDASNCDGDSVAAMNKCLCSDSNGKFVSNAATCLGKEAKDTLRTVYQSMSTACSDSKTPIALTEDQFLNLGARGATASLSVTLSKTSTSAAPTTFMTTTTGGATVTVTSAPTPTSTAEPEESGLSTTAKIAVGVGAGAGAIALVCLAAFIWRIKRSRDAHDESHRPMLGGGVGAVGGRDPHHGPYTEYSPPASVAGGRTYAAHEYKNENKQQSGWRPPSEVTQSTSPGAQTWATNSPQPPYAQPQQQQQHAWGHHPQAAYVPPPPQQHAPRQDGVFELASMPVFSAPPASKPPPNAVEMPATEVQPHPPRYQYPSQG